ncbi:DNA topoisomerase III [compost metagenome]
MILQQPIERIQMQKLLTTGRTDLFTRFISKKGRPFKAYLAKTAEGKVGFEFEARKPKVEKPALPAPAKATRKKPAPAAATAAPVKSARAAPAVKPVPKTKRKAA